MAIERITISEVQDEQFITLREVTGERRLSFALGMFEALTIDRTIKRVSFSRPLTHDAWLSSIAALGAALEAVCIHDREGHMYFAELRVNQAGRSVRVDVRPSDGVVLALKTGVPLLVGSQLLVEVAESE